MEKQNKIITYSIENMLQNLDFALEQIRVFSYDSQYRQYLGNEFVDKFIEWESLIAKQKNNPFTLVVIGDFKRGKSTLINALLKEYVVTTDVTTETVTMNRICYGMHDNEAVLSQGRRIKLSDAELKRESLERVFADIGEPITRLEIKRTNDFLKKVTIIDTPGMDDALKDYTNVVKESLLQADAVIYVFNCMYLLSKTEQFFLRSAILPQKYTELFIVGNFADNIISSKEAERMRELALTRLHGLLPEAKVYMISALDETCRIMNEERPAPSMVDFLEQEFSNLLQNLNNMIDEKEESVVLDRMQRLCLGMIAELEEELDGIDQGLHMDKESATAALDKLYAENNAMINSQEEMLNKLLKQVSYMQSDTKKWMSDFLHRMAEETNNLKKESDENLRKYYECYCVDLLQNALNTCLDYHQEQLYEILEDINASLTIKLTESMTQRRNFQFRFKLDNRVWTKGDNVGLVVSMLHGQSNSLLAAIGLMAVDGITGYLREREIANRVPELISQINRKMLGLSLSVDKTVEGLYGDLSEKISKILTEFFQEEKERKMHLIQQAIKISEKDAANKEKIANMLISSRKLLDSVRYVMPVTKV